MKLSVARKGFALVPVTDDDREALLTMEAGEVFHFEFKKQRNSAFHRKFFALLQVIATLSDTYDTVEKALVAVKILVGHCDFHRVGTELVAVPKSISFAKMDDVAFTAFYSKALDAALAHLTPTMDRVSLDKAVDEIVRFA